MQNFPVYDGWSRRTEGAQRQQRREGVYTTFLKTPVCRTLRQAMSPRHGIAACPADNERSLQVLGR